MHTELKLRNISSERILKEYIERRLTFAMSRYGERVSRVTVRIGTAAGGKTEDRSCHITADLHPFGVITAEAIDRDVYSAIDRCVGRLARRFQSKSAQPRSVRSSRASIRVPDHHLAA